MARLHQSGWELQSVTAGVEWDTITGSPTINTTIKRSGAASMRANPSSASWYVEHDCAASTTKKFVRVYVYIATAPSALTDILALGTSGDAYHARIQLATNRTLELWHNTAKVGSSSSALSLNTWYRVELTYDDSIADNTVWGYLDGTQFATGTGSNAGGNGRVRIGVITSTTADLYFDDFGFNNSTGTPQSNLPGAGSIAHLRPNATGDSQTAGITLTGDTPGWKCIDDVTPDDNTTYIGFAATTDTVDVNLDSSATVGIGSGDPITLVAMGWRFSATTAAACNVNGRVRSASAGTTATSGAINVAVTAWNTHDDGLVKVYNLVSYTDPTTAAAWTPTGTNSLDNAQIGFTSSDATPDPLITAAWLLVEYVPVAPATISVSDSVTVSESIEVLHNNTRHPSKSETVTVTDSASHYADLVATRESVTVQVVQSPLSINVSDSTTVTDTPVVSLGDSSINVSDTATVSDTPIVRVESYVTVSDSTTVTDTPIVVISDPGINVSDPTTVTDTPTVRVESNISVSDSTTVTEATTVVVSGPQISVSDTTTVSDTPTLMVESYINVNDNPSVSENTVVTITAINDLDVNVSDSITITDTPTVRVESNISVSDSTTVTEATTVVVSDPQISVSDSTTVADTPTVVVESNVSVSDSTTVTDTPTVVVSDPQISVSDSTTVTDTPTISIQTDEVSVNVSDTVAASESTTLYLVSFINTSDTSTVSDSPLVVITGAGELNIPITETITVSESSTVVIGAVGQLTISVTDTITVGESSLIAIQGAGTFNIAVSDATSVTETVTVVRTLGNIAALGFFNFFE